jgi:hypothetical protein
MKKHYEGAETDDGATIKHKRLTPILLELSTFTEGNNVVSARAKILGESLPATPSRSEQITIEGRTYRIMSVCKDKGGETYTLHLEKA